MDYNEIFRNRTKKFSIRVIQTLSALSYTDAVSVIRKQTIRSATSVAANYRATNRARSNKEKFAKLCIVVEEADETLFWLELIEELEILDSKILEELKNECEEILKVMSKYKHTLSQSTK